MLESLEIHPKTKQKSAQRRHVKPSALHTVTKEELTAQVREELNRLPTLERGALQHLWRELFGAPPNPKLRRELLVLVLTYRIQEKAYGGLKPSTRKKLLSYAEGFSKEREIIPVQDRVTKPGTRIVREWGNRLHEVTVADIGYSYNGTQYRSLSEIARLITGTRWSGPAFFGLKTRHTKVAA